MYRNVWSYIQIHTKYEVHQHIWGIWANCVLNVNCPFCILTVWPIASKLMTITYCNDKKEWTLFLKACMVIKKFLLTKFWIWHGTCDRWTRGSGGAERQTDCSVHPPAKTSASDGFCVRHPGGWIDGSDRLLSGRREKVATRVRVPTFGNHQLHRSADEKSPDFSSTRIYFKRNKSCAVFRCISAKLRLHLKPAN